MGDGDLTIEERRAVRAQRKQVAIVTARVLKVRVRKNQKFEALSYPAQARRKSRTTGKKSAQNCEHSRLMRRAEHTGLGARIFRFGVSSLCQPQVLCFVAIYFFLFITFAIDPAPYIISSLLPSLNR